MNSCFIICRRLNKNSENKRIKSTINPNRLDDEYVNILRTKIQNKNLKKIVLLKELRDREREKKQTHQRTKQLKADLWI